MPTVIRLFSFEDWVDGWLAFNFLLEFIGCDDDESMFSIFSTEDIVVAVDKRWVVGAGLPKLHFDTSRLKWTRFVEADDGVKDIF